MAASEEARLESLVVSWGRSRDGWLPRVRVEVSFSEGLR